MSPEVEGTDPLNTDTGNPSANRVLAVVLTAYLMIVLDLSIVYTGLPEIGETMSLGPVGLTWVQNAYLLCFGGFLLLSARAGDLFGFKRMLLWGIALFAASSLIIGLAQTPVELIGARAVQGVGASMIAPSVLSLISAFFHEGEGRSRALAWYSMVAGAGASLGMVMGGIFAGTLSWRVGFLINVPIGLGLWLAANRALTHTPRGDGRLDVAGAITSTVGMVALVWGIVRTTDQGWTDPLVLAALTLAVLSIGLFLWIQARTKEPLLPLTIFASQVRSGAYAARMCFVGAVVSFFFFETQLMQQVLGFSPLQAGLGFLPMTVPTFFAALLVPRLTRAWGNANLLCVALASMTVGMIWLSFAGEQTGYWAGIALPMVLLGLGNGGALGPLTVAGVTDVSGRNRGAASGAVNVAHQLGGSLGLSILATIFAAAYLPSLPQRMALEHQVSTAILSAGVLLALGLVIALVFIWPNEQRAAANRGSQ
ncbi:MULTISPECIES: MFS transporter [Stutzerimonas stutzeri subgroup]|uniref:Major facilitator transporter n=1 Tax=Stutzerimonas stutzeri CCUG 29243 TaxID=1196835 RepID=I4CXI4_STUST|nr:MFS transporter [Stutzerimonas stutzeri]AFM34791.1 major facilitator transporter [Stutzerimonas stutzeri CCUG 29243]MCQ2040726.1 MFS transporter [Stutzerimonas kunmingensis]